MFLLGALPLLALVALQVAQNTPDCRAWRAEVDSRANVDRKLSPFQEYHRGEMSVDEYFGNVRDQVAYDLRESRPPFCF